MNSTIEKIKAAQIDIEAAKRENDMNVARSIINSGIRIIENDLIQSNEFFLVVGSDIYKSIKAINNE